MHPLDKNIQDLRKERDTLKSLEKLMGNPDFKKLILDDYLTKHPLMLLKRKGTLNLNPQFNQDIDRQLDAIALFDMYLNNQLVRLTVIEEKISEAETQRENELRNI